MKTGKTEVRQKLGVVNRQQALDSLQLQDHTPLDNEIGTEPDLHPDSLMHHANRILTRETETRLRHLECQDVIVNRFEQPGSECPAGRESAADDSVRERISLVCRQCGRTHAWNLQIIRHRRMIFLPAG